MRKFILCLYKALKNACHYYLIIIMFFIIVGCSKQDDQSTHEKSQQVVQVFNVNRYEEIREEVESIRQEAYKLIDLTGSTEPLDHDRIGAHGLKDAFIKNDGGVLCAGSALMLHGAYRDLGYNAYIFSYGFENTLTHTVVLVEINGELYLQDAHYNYSFRKPLFDILKDLINGITPEYYHGMPEFRDVHYKSIESMHHSWTFDGNDPYQNCIYDGEKYICRSVNTYNLFLDRYNMEATNSILVYLGHPPNFSYALLYPIWLASSDGYTESYDSPLHNGLLGKMAKYINEQSGGKIDPIIVRAQNDN